MINKELSAGTLKGIRTALKEPVGLYFPNFDIIEGKLSRNFIQCVKLHNARMIYRFPSWDLNLVLWILKCREDSDHAVWIKKVRFITFFGLSF